MNLDDYTLSEHDVLDRQSLDDLGERDLALELERRRLWLAWAEQRHATILAELPALHDEHARRLHASAAVEPQLTHALVGTLLPNQLGVHPDAQWRAEYPQAAKLRDQYQGLQQAAHDMQLLINRRELERDRLKFDLIPGKRGLVESAEHALADRRASREKAAMDLARADPPTLRERLERLVGR